MSDTTFQAAFFVVPSRIMNLPGLTLAFLKVYETVFQFWNHGKSCFLSNEKIMERTGILSASTVKDACVFFEKHKEMIRQQRGTRRYLIQPTLLIETDTNQEPVDNSSNNSSNTSQVASSAAGGSQQRGGGGASSAAHNNKKYNNKKLSKSFYKDLEQKSTNEKKHDWAAMKNEAAAIKQCQKFKYLRE